MFKIGEFSKLTQVSVRMLRYYDETGLLKPAEIDAWTGYRMYSVEQIPELNKIIYLRDSGFNVSEIAAALNVQDDKSVIEQLDIKKKEIEQNIQSEIDKLKKIELAKIGLQGSRNEMHYNIIKKSVPEYQVLSLRRKIPTYYAEGILWKELSSFARQNEIRIASDTFTIYHDSEYREQDIDVEVCAPVKKMGKDMGEYTYRIIESVDNMASTMVCGDFSNIKKAYLAFAQWLQKNAEYHRLGKERQIVHRGPWNESNPEKYLVEIQIPFVKI